MIKTPFRKPVLAVQWDRTKVDYVLAERKGGKVDHRRRHDRAAS